MMRIIKIVSVFLISTLLTLEAMAETSAFLNQFEESWTLGIGLGRDGLTIQHTEASSGSFSALGGSTKNTNMSYNLTLMKEFMHQKRFSITALVTGGMIDGGADGTEAGISYEETSSGAQFGGGVSANLNYHYTRMKVQPYLGVNILQESTTYKMNYTSGSAIETSYDYSGTLAHINLGIRVLDPEVGLMSYFNVAFINPMSESVAAKATVGGVDNTLTVVGVEKGQVFAAFGFGFIF